MNIIHVRLRQSPYKIVIGHNILSKLGAFLKKNPIGKDAVIITNRVILRLYGRPLVAGLKKHGFSAKILVVPDTEKSKSSKVAIDLLQKIAQHDVKRKIFIVAFGGGVVGDLAGFLASIYKRGVPYIQVPTTFLAQIDSAIGGKTAIDLSVGKNLVGAFYQPKCVWSDVSVLKTLSKRQMRNGLAEAVKYGVIQDKLLFLYMQKNLSNVFAHNKNTMTKIIACCSTIKARVVEADERETRDIRTILNFGHTAGHAIEAAGRYAHYHHGEAVALGMRIAARIAVDMKLLSMRYEQMLNDLLTEIGLPAKIKKIRLASILRVIEHDKKFRGKINKFVLPIQIGKVKVVQKVPNEIIKKAIKAYL